MIVAVAVANTSSTKIYMAMATATCQRTNPRHIVQMYVQGSNMNSYDRKRIGKACRRKKL